tara:strand:+ start:4474 stop:5355 length:882 start_codon:yes stop_codon:yes gene_type:complete
MKNKLIASLIDMDISTNESLHVIHPRTRDNNNLNVLKCAKSGLIVLEEVIINKDYYVQAEKRGSTIADGQKINPQHLEDDQRRFKAHKEFLEDKEVLDFGCGVGGFLQLSNTISKNSVGLELNQEHVEIINNLNIKCVSSFEDLYGKHMFDTITLNHVLEHLEDPFDVLSNLKMLLKDNGTIIIEVPHARDILLETFNLEDFKDFTFWSEHLILHTQDSLTAFAHQSGLELQNMECFQRYPLANHFNWLLEGKPGGHEKYSQLNDDEFHKHYEAFLKEINQTDTLIGYFGKAN